MKNNNLKKMVSPSKISSGEFSEYSLNQNVDWVKELLMELNENAVEQTPEAYLDQTNLDIELSLKSHFEATIGTILLAKAKISAHFATSCTLSLKEVFDQVSFEVDACFLPGHLEEAQEFEEQTEFFVAGAMRELYFLKKGHADLSEFIHEHIFLNINPYPKAEESEDDGGMMFESGKLKN